MLRTIIKIDQDACNGCGLCAEACHEGAIVMVDGKAQLLRDDYCDGLGNCLPVCPTGAITFEEREADAFDEEAVAIHMAKLQAAKEAGCHSHHHGEGHGHHHGEGHGHHQGGGCPGTRSRALSRSPQAESPAPTAQGTRVEPVSHLAQWPVQIRLVPISAPYFQGAHLLIAADCTAFAYGDFHHRFMQNKVTIFGCPKLDDVDYSEKLTEILRRNDIKSVTIARMEVPCCTGLLHAAQTALRDCGKMIPWKSVVLSTDGQILEDF